MLWVGLFSSVTGCFYYLFWQFWDWLSQKFSISVSLDNTGIFLTQIYQQKLNLLTKKIEIKNKK